MGDAANDAFDQAMFELMDDRYIDEDYESNCSICPICGAITVLRKGPYGNFYGCSTYPKCKGNIDY